MPEVPVARRPTLNEKQSSDFVEQLASGFGQQLRSPLMHRPSEIGLVYENVTFPSADGTPIEGWFIPAASSNKVVIINHPMGFSRCGLPSHLDPWKSAWASSGNDFEVNFLPRLQDFARRGLQRLVLRLAQFRL